MTRPRSLNASQRVGEREEPEKCICRSVRFIIAAVNREKREKKKEERCTVSECVLCFRSKVIIAFVIL